MATITTEAAREIISRSAEALEDRDRDALDRINEELGQVAGEGEIPAGMVSIVDNLGPDYILTTTEGDVLAWGEEVPQGGHSSRRIVLIERA